MEFSELQIQDYKKKYGKVYLITVTDDEGKDYNAVFRKPDIKILSAASKFEKEPFKAGIILFDNCWIAGDEEIKTQDDLKIAAMNVMESMFTQYTAKIKKL